MARAAVVRDMTARGLLSIVVCAGVLVRAASPAFAAPIAILPSDPVVAPLETVTFTVSGGTGAGHWWALPGNASNGSIDPPSGRYRAGGFGNVVDRVGVSDSAGNLAVIDVRISAPVAITPASASVPPRGTISFTATGGKAPFAWSMATRASGGTVDPVTGVYRAGPTSADDRVRVTDSVGATSDADIVLGAGVTVAPATVSVLPGATLALVASGGTGPYTWSLDPNASGATVSATGVYVAGATGGTDGVVAKDGLGNVGSASITVAGPPAKPPLPFVGVEGGGGCRAGGGAHGSSGAGSSGGLLLVLACAATVGRRAFRRSARRANE